MKKHFLIFTISLLFFSLAQGKVKLPAMMGDHMVLQQNSSVKLWGWADGKKVTVTTSWNNRTYRQTMREHGWSKWILLPEVLLLILLPSVTEPGSRYRIY